MEASATVMVAASHVHFACCPDAPDQLDEELMLRVKSQNDHFCVADLSDWGYRFN